jgi:hypothetical protein
MFRGPEDVILNFTAIKFFPLCIIIRAKSVQVDSEAIRDKRFVSTSKHAGTLRSEVWGKLQVTRHFRASPTRSRGTGITPQLYDDEAVVYRGRSPCTHD